MAADITNSIIDQVIASFPGMFNTGISTSDPLYLRSIVKAPLQDDPTQQAFYLEVGPDTTMEKLDSHWRMPVQSIRRGRLGIEQQMPELEIGGGYKMINFFLVHGWLPTAGSREIAFANAGKALRRLERAFARLANNQFFAGIATDDGTETTGGVFPHVFGNDGAHFELTGGDAEWYPKVFMRFHVFTEIARGYWE